MNKAEDFIEKHIKTCSNQYDFPEYFENGIKRLKEYQPWITLNQAREAVEIAKEEIMEKTLDFFKERLYKSGYVGIMDLCDDYIKAMKDE